MKKILVANRGEIALRVMKTIKKLGISVVAVYSEADRNAPHVLFADEAVCIGPPASSKSYLRGDKIIEVALQTGAEAIHPGYGFLSENASFAKAVEEAGLIFIGPSAYSIEIMGNKLAAKDAVKKYNIPMVPGIDEAVTDTEKAIEVARSIGFPVLIKAAAGGGGKGMRVVERAEEVEEQIQRAISEAQAAFGDGSVFVEKFITNPRHIEIQILADQHGNTLYLFERECSVQRRHQKVVEEAPSAIVTPEMRKAMGEAAVKVAQSCNYVNAGTVEFLVDEDRNFYFLEMNTRLQVEHPVTELIVGLDLVEQQLRIAQGLPLEIKQEDLEINGHAIELRVYAENPFNNFLPEIGTLTTYTPPVGEGIRLDSGYTEGMEIPIYYDPMISKLITYGPTRAAAIKRMLEAIEMYQIEGVITTMPFGKFVMQHEAFTSGQFDTGFVKKHFTKEAIEKQQEQAANIAAKIGLMLYQETQDQLKEPSNNGGMSKWFQARS